MTSVRGKGQPAVGSARWLYDEREVAQQFVEQEVEEFAFSARNEFEWLNEHMSDIFSQNQLLAIRWLTFDFKNTDIG